MQAIKVSSSKIIKTKSGFEHFVAWGEGYAALSKSMDDKEKVINYIINQKDHHKTISFKDEYSTFIKEMGLIIDERDWNR